MYLQEIRSNEYSGLFTLFKNLSKIVLNAYFTKFYYCTIINSISSILSKNKKCYLEIFFTAITQVIVFVGLNYKESSFSFLVSITWPLVFLLEDFCLSSPPAFFHS